MQFALSAKRVLSGMLLALLWITPACQFYEDKIFIVKQPAELNGIWQVQGYGRLFEIVNGKATRYDITTKTAMKVEENIDVSGWKVRTNANRTEITAILPDALTEFHLAKRKEMPEVVKNHLLQPTNDPLVNFDVMWQTFQENYPFFELRGVSREAMKAKYRSQVTENNLFEVFSEMLAPLQDGHVGLQAGEETFVADGKSILIQRFEEEGEYTELAEFYDQEIKGKLRDIIFEKYLGGSHKTGANKRLRWGKLNEKTGYLYIAGMIGFADGDAPTQLSALNKALDAAMEDLQSAESLVVDIRLNGGGSDLASQAIAGRFTNTTFLAWTKQAKNGDGFTPAQKVFVKPTGKFQYTKPVVLLTSQITASAGETFALAMKQIPHVKLVGQSTNGIFSDVLEKPLPNGWLLGLGNELHLAPDGSSVEGIGIQPHVTIPAFPTQDRKTGRDSYLDKALELL